MWRGGAVVGARPLRLRLLGNPPHHPFIGGTRSSSPATSSASPPVVLRPPPSRFLANITHHLPTGGASELLPGASSPPPAATVAEGTAPPPAATVAEGTPASSSVTDSPQGTNYSEALRLFGACFSKGYQRSWTIQQRKLSTSSSDDDPSRIPDLMSARVLPVISDTMEFPVYVGNALEFLAEYESDKDKCMKEFSVAELKKLFEAEVAPALEVRCLISPFGLEGFDAARLHYSYWLRIGDFPNYLTSLDLMTILKTMKKDRWGPYLDYLCRERFLIVIDWTRRLNTDAAATLYDYGLIFASPPGDKRSLYKGECDASVKGTLAKLSFMVWNGIQVSMSQVYYNIPCNKDDNNQAEAFAMYLMLKRLVEEDMHLHKVEVRTDNRLVYEVLSGVHALKENSNNYELYMLLRYMRRFFRDLICLWAPREKLMFVDGLIRGPILKENNEQRAAEIAKMQKGWAPYLRGEPIFISRLHSSTAMSKLKKISTSKKLQIIDTHRSCYLEVADQDKVSALWHVGVALRPASRVYVALKKSKSRPNIISQMNQIFLNGVADCSMGEEYTLLSFDDSRLSKDEASGVDLDLLIIFDASISKVPVISENTFVVYLCTPEETEIMIEQLVPKYGPLSFVSFCPTTEARRDQTEKERKMLAVEEDLNSLLRDVRRALVLLASDGMLVSKEREETLNLVIKEINTLMIARQDTETEETSVQETVSSVLLAQVNVMLQELEKEVDDVDAHIMCSVKLFDRDYDGQLTLQEKIVKDHIQYLIFKLYRDGKKEEQGVTEEINLREGAVLVPADGKKEDVTEGTHESKGAVNVPVEVNEDVPAEVTDQKEDTN